METIQENSKVIFESAGKERKSGTIKKITLGDNDGMGDEYLVQLRGPGGKKIKIYHNYNKVRLNN